MTVRLLIAFDASPAALRAVELVAAYAGEPRLLAVSVLNVQSRPVSLWPGAGLDPAAVDAALLKAGARALQPALARIAARSEVRLGLPAAAILHEAAGHDAVAVDALVVVGD